MQGSETTPAPGGGARTSTNAQARTAERYNVPPEPSVVGPARRILPGIATLVRRMRSDEPPKDIKRLSRASSAGGPASAGLLSRDSTGSLSSVDTDSGKRLSRISSNSGRGNKIMHAKAASKFAQMSTTYKSRKQLQAQEQVYLPKYIVHPNEIWAQCWWGLILVGVLVTMWSEPYSLAFSEFPGLFPPTAPDTIITILLMAIYAVDIVLNFFVAFYEDEQLVVELRAIAWHYAASGRLALDLLTTIPFDWIVLGAVGLQESDSTTARYISLLRLLRTGRVYRLRRWLVFLTNNQAFSLMAVTLVRNSGVVFYVVHWAACGLYYIARQGGFSELTWIGASMSWLPAGTTIDRYVYSMYWSIITFATVGYGDFHAYNVAEMVFTFIYVFISIGIGAYIVGTITLLVTKADEEKAMYRNSMTALDAYSTTHDIPKDLKDSMKGHLRLHYSNLEASDEHVLASYPTTIRRRILRHLYLSSLSCCWLFDGCGQKFMDALLTVSKVELFMPKIEVLAEGDHLNELFILVGGEAELERSQGSASTEHVILEMDTMESVHGGRAKLLSAGDVFGEMAFFTETCNMEAVRTNTVCRVMVLSRQAYQGLLVAFPLSVKTLLDNVLQMAEIMVEAEFHGPGASQRALKDFTALPGLSYKFCSPELADPSHHPTPDSPVAGADSRGTGPIAQSSNGTSTQQLSAVHGSGSLQQGPGPFAAPAAGGDGAGLSSFGGGRPQFQGHQQAPFMDPSLGVPLGQRQQASLANLVRVRALVSAQRDRIRQQRTNDFLSAASKGNCERIKMMLEQGFSADSRDYDHRSALMLAAAKGHIEAAQLLLAAGANPSATDCLGGCPLLEACKGGFDDMVALLMGHGARLTMTGVMTAAYTCTCVFEGDLALLRRLLHAGADPDAADYDKRTALHIAAADGSLAAVKLLVEEGGANHALQDRWGATALDEARRVGANTVVDYLEPLLTDVVRQASLRKFNDVRTEQMLRACSSGDSAAVRYLLARGCPPDSGDYDNRTGLMLAAVQGHLGIVQQLLAANAHPNVRDNLGGCALLEACRAGHDAIIDALVAKGGRVEMGGVGLAALLCECVFQKNMALLARLLRAGVDVDAADYDGRTALMIAAAEGNADMVSLLVESGANASLLDRWGNDAAAEARRIMAAPIVELLSANAMQ